MKLDKLPEEVDKTYIKILQIKKTKRDDKKLRLLAPVSEPVMNMASRLSLAMKAIKDLQKETRLEPEALLEIGKPLITNPVTAGKQVETDASTPGTSKMKKKVTFEDSTKDAKRRLDMSLTAIRQTDGGITGSEDSSEDDDDDQPLAPVGELLRDQIKAFIKMSKKLPGRPSQSNKAIQAAIEQEIAIAKERDEQEEQEPVDVCWASFIISQEDVDEPSESENEQDQEQVKGDAMTFERIDPTTFERINEVDNDLIAKAAEARGRPSN